MVNPWHKTRRSVEEDYKFYDSPRVIHEKITSKTWPYSNKPEYRQLSEQYKLRDLAYMALMYASTCRASELCRFQRKDKNTNEVEIYKPSVTRNQFHFSDGYLNFREVIILKRRELDLETEEWVAIKDVENYPTRNEISLPLDGGFAELFTNPIIEYIDTLEPEDELFPFRYRRGWQIVSHVTGEMQHYLRDMGIKFYSRLLDRNIKDLQDFTGHARIQNLSKYLGEGQIRNKLKNVEI